MKKIVVSALLVSFFVAAGCTTVVKAPPPKRHIKVRPGCRDVWVPGHHTRHGAWVKGHWETRCR